MRDGLAIQDIGAVSTHAKIIIAAHSGPIVACFNRMTKDYVKKWIILMAHPIYHRELNNVVVPNTSDIERIVDEEWVAIAGAEHKV
jgi:hypothetical protein